MIGGRNCLDSDRVRSQRAHCPLARIVDTRPVNQWKGGEVFMSINLNLDPLRCYIGDYPDAFFATGTRQLSSGEEKELRRIFKVITDAGSDPNVQDVYLKNPISQRQLEMILSSQCPKLIEATFMLLEFDRHPFKVQNDKYSLWLYALTRHPEILPVLQQELHWSYRSDLSDVLKEIRVYILYYRRPKRAQRHKGYRDKGSMQPEQTRLRQSCLTDYYAELAEQLARTDREFRDTVELLVGSIV